MARDVKDAELVAGRSKAYTGLPSQSPEANDVRVRMGALEDTVMTQMTQV
jgi:hypothetical protein